MSTGDYDGKIRPGETHSGGVVVHDRELVPQSVTYLTVPTPQLMTAEEMERAKRRAHFPANRKGERAFQAAERRAGR